jgi:hypothetical protein
MCMTITPSTAARDPDSNKKPRVCGAFTSQWAIQDSNLGPLPYQRMPAPLPDRESPAFSTFSGLRARRAGSSGGV